jgi:integrase
MSGHIYKRSDTWTYVIDTGVDPATGKRRQKSKGGFKTKKAAILACDKVALEVDGNTYVAEQHVTFEVYMREWLRLYGESGQVKPSTLRLRDYGIRKLEPYFAKLQLKDITRKRYQDALSDLKQSGLSQTTLSGIHAAGSMLFAKAVEHGVIKVNPTTYAQIPANPQALEPAEAENVKYLEKPELKTFLDAARQYGYENDYMIFTLLAYTGMRIGELCALQWQDINLENGEIRINKTYYSPNGRRDDFLLMAPKTKASRRTVDIDLKVVEALKKHRQWQNEAKMVLRGVYAEQGFVFAKMGPSPGKPYHQKNVEERMRRLLNLAGLNPKLTPHSLRHTHTSLLAEAGVGLQEIMERLGHADDVITRRIYLHVTRSMKKEASRKFGEFMRGL